MNDLTVKRTESEFYNVPSDAAPWKVFHSPEYLDYERAQVSPDRPEQQYLLEAQRSGMAIDPRGSGALSGNEVGTYTRLRPGMAAKEQPETARNADPLSLGQILRAGAGALRSK
jgi:hypothetical protein